MPFITAITIEINKEMEALPKEKKKERKKLADE